MLSSLPTLSVSPFLASHNQAVESQQGSRCYCVPLAELETGGQSWMQAEVHQLAFQMEIGDHDCCQKRWARCDLEQAWLVLETDVL